MNELLVYSEKYSPRLQYILQFALEQTFGIKLNYITDYYVFTESEKPKLACLKENNNDFPTIILNEFLFDKDIKKNLTTNQLTPIEKAFYTLSRYEEYINKERDEHGRFSGKKNAIKTPEVDEWAIDLLERIKGYYPNIKETKPNFNFINTIDIDEAFLVKNRSFDLFVKRLIYLMLNQYWSDAFKVLKAKLFGAKDPFDIYQKVKDFSQKKKIKTLYFWLMSSHQHPLDRNLPTHRPKFQEIIQRNHLKPWIESALHPSYYSNMEENILYQEKEALENILNEKCLKSRQHYIKMEFPTTYRNLLQVGIKEDYSMGYADACGFRAGTAQPFFWYDLENDKITDLKVFPFVSMDGILRKQMKLNPEEAMEQLKNLIEQVRKVNGTFICIWHNESISGYANWKNWDRVYFKMLEEVC